jgi:hypothetical protein
MMLATNINQNFKNLDVDYLYHLGLDSSMDISKIFSNVSTVIFTENNYDALFIANEISKQIFNLSNLSYSLNPLFKTERYHLYLIKNFIVISTGIGNPSTLICLNEISKLLFHANILNPYYIQITPSIGLNNNNNIQLIKTVFNHNYKNYYENISCGHYYNYQSNINQNNINKFINKNQKFNVNISNSITVPDLICSIYNNYINESFIQENNILSANMDNSVFAGFCNYMNIRSLIFNYIINQNYNKLEISQQNLNNIINMILGYFNE